MVKLLVLLPPPGPAQAVQHVESRRIARARLIGEQRRQRDPIIRASVPNRPTAVRKRCREGKRAAMVPCNRSFSSGTRAAAFINRYAWRGVMLLPVAAYS